MNNQHVFWKDWLNSVGGRRQAAPWGVAIVAVTLLLMLIAGGGLAQEDGGTGGVMADETALSNTGTTAAASGPPILINYQGELTDANGVPQAGVTVDITFMLYQQPTGGVFDWKETHTGITTDSNGRFNVILNSAAAAGDLDNLIQTNTGLWLEVTINNETLSPRQRLASVSYALTARQSITSTAAASAQSAPWSGLTGLPAGFADDVDNDTQYTAGIGLTLTNSEFSANFGGDGSANTAARSDHNHFGETWSGTGTGLTISGTINATSGGFQFPDGTTQVTAAREVPPGVIVMWSGFTVHVPAGWALADGTNGTPDLRGKFIYGTNPGEQPGYVGGTITHTHGTYTTTFTGPPIDRPGYPSLESVPSPQSGQPVTNVAGGSHIHGVNIDFDTLPSSNLPPFYKLAFIMKCGSTPGNCAAP